MSLDTYTNLKTSIASWLLRPGDSDVAANADDFIDLCEEELFKRLRIKAMEYRDSALTLSDEYTALPTGFIEFKKITNNAAPYTDLSLVDSSFLADHFGNDHSSNDLYYAIQGNKIRVSTGVTSVDAIYFKKFDALSGSVATNDVLTNFPSLYLWGCLKYAALFFKDDPAQWEAKFEQSLSSANTSENRSRYSGSTIEMRVRRAP